MTEERWIRMEIKGLMIDPSSNHPIVILRDQESHRFLPIWIGIFEASAIQLELEGVERPRPMTHDLLRSTIESLGYELSRVVVSDLREHTFFAELHLERPGGGEAVVIDSRPSDAIALALRAGSPLFVAPHVLESSKVLELPSEGSEDDEERLRKYLEELGDEDLGKYTM